MTTGRAAISFVFVGLVEFVRFVIRGAKFVPGAAECFQRERVP